MTAFTILVVLISAFFHVSWNMIGKSRTPSGAFFFMTELFSVLLFLPVYILWAHYRLFPVKVLFYPIVGGFFQALYYVGLGKGYKQGDMSYIYPTARALPVLFVTVLTMIFQTGENIRILSFLGIILVFLGCLALPLEEVSGNWIKKYLSKSSLFAFMAAAGTTGYSIVDSMGMNYFFKNIPQHTVKFVVSPDIFIPIVYISYEMLSAAVFLGIYIFVSKKERLATLYLLKTGKKYTAAAGLLIVLAYTLILWAYTQTSNVSYVTAFRQISIPLGTAGGLIILKERGTPGKIIGSSIIFAGLILTALGT